MSFTGAVPVVAIRSSAAAGSLGLQNAVSFLISALRDVVIVRCPFLTAALRMSGSQFKVPGLSWRAGPDYSWVRPALHAKKVRDLELRAGHPQRRGQKGASYNYNISQRRNEERDRILQAEGAYRRLTTGWQRRGPRVKLTDAANEE